MGLLLALVPLLSSGCVSGQSFDQKVGSIVKPYRFNAAVWELDTLSQQLRQWLAKRDGNSGSGADKVVEYFALRDSINAVKLEINAGRGTAQSQAGLSRLEAQEAAPLSLVTGLMQQQVRDTLAQQGIYQPLDRYIGLKVNFPPVYFVMQPTPHLLVVSPRDRISLVKSVLLKADLDLSQIKDIESRTDNLNVSSLVEDIGGLGSTYPSLVTNDANVEFIIDTAVHEWVHQYLAFTPLGFRYALHLIGVVRNHDIASMNETVANMVGKEISTLVRRQYYPENESTEPKVNPPLFNFNREMRDIRKAVDQYLAGGEIEVAEKFMEEKRQYLADNGYYIRKLNQAYFAFHGGYGDRPAFRSPIGTELKTLRARSASLRSFIDTVATMTSRQDLKVALGAASAQ